MDLAKGIEKGVISSTANVHSVWFDTLQHIFIVCMEDNGQFPNKKGNRYQLRIPKLLTSRPMDNRLEYKHRNVSELKPEEEIHWWRWNLYRDRKDVKVYDLAISPDYHCYEPSKSWVDVPLLKAPKGIPNDNANKFRGDKVVQMLSRKMPFLVYINNGTSLTLPDDLCNSVSEEVCLLLVANPNMKNQDNPEISFAEVFTIDQLIWTSESKPAWYLTLPFAVAADVAIFAIILFFFGAAGGHGA